MSFIVLSLRIYFILGKRNANPLSYLSLFWMLSKAISKTISGLTIHLEPSSFIAIDRNLVVISPISSLDKPEYAFPIVLNLQ